MAKELTWVDYLDRLPGGPSDRQIASAANTAPSTVTRWRSGQDPNPRHAAMIARHFGLSPLTAFVAAGYLTTDELSEIFENSGVSDQLSLESTPTATLLEIALRRIRDGEENGIH